MEKTLNVQYFPAEGFDMGQLDLSDLTKVYYSGLYERTVTLSNGTRRSYKIYVPTTATYGDDCIYLAVPGGVDTARFLLDSGWVDVAEDEKNAVILCVMEPVNQAWGDVETEVEYVEKAFRNMYSDQRTLDGGRSLVYINDFNHRWVGYGAGGEMMQRYAMTDPMSVTSLVILDGSDGISKEYADKTAAICFTNSYGHTYTEWPNSKIPVPVWLIGAENEAVIHRWKVANECTGKREELADGYCYYQNPLSCNLMTFDQKVGQIRVTKSAETYLDLGLTKKVYEFLHSFARTGANSPYGNMLYNAPADSMFKRDTMISDGMEREWYVYVPSGYTGEEPLPLVFYFHGSGQSGLIGMRQGNWWQYGELKNFITVCPSGSLRARAEGQIPTIIWRSGTPGMKSARPWVGLEDTQIENRFVRGMLAKLQKQYNIDASRIYITGQSNGGCMTQMMSDLGRDLFAAAASTGVPSIVSHTPLPVFCYGGEWDLVSAAFDSDGNFRDASAGAAIRSAVEAAGLKYEDSGFFTNGIFDNLQWLDEKGVPSYRYCCANGQAHSWRQDIARMIWDEWFCRFSRNLETGEIKYLGK